MTEPIQLDKDINIPDRTPVVKRSKKKGISKTVISIIVAAVFAIIIVILLVPGRGSAAFDTSMSNSELDMRDLMSDLAREIHHFQSTTGTLPVVPGDIEIPATGILFNAEDDSSWYISSGDSLVYFSDMDISEFQEGEI